MAFQEVGVQAVVRGAGKYLSDLDRMNKATTGFGSRLGSALGIGAAAGAAALGTTGIASLKLASDFEDSMARIAGLTDLPAESIEGLSHDILELAKTLPKSPEELGSAAYFILSAGITDAATAMEVLELAARASSTGLGETETVAKALTAIINAYGLSASDAAKVTDQFVQTVKSGAGEPAELAASIGQVIPFAAQMGVEFEQVGAVLAQLTNAGIDTSTAVTDLKGIFTQLLSPTGKADRLGL